MFVFDWCGMKVTFLRECMGTRSVVALLALAAILAFQQRSMACRVSLFGFAVLYAVVGTVFRIGCILAICTISCDFAFGMWHDFSGYLFFVAEVLMLAKTADKMFQRRSRGF